MTDKLKKESLAQQAVDDIVANNTYGDIIDLKWLKSMLDIKEPEHGTKKQYEQLNFLFMASMDELKAELLFNHQMYLDNVRGKGYRIVNPSQQSDLAMNKLKSTVSVEMKKAINVLTHVKHDMLTQEAAQRNLEHLGKIAALKSFSQKRLN